MVAGSQNTDSRFDIGTSMPTVLYTVCQEIRKMECFWQTIAQTLVKEIHHANSSNRDFWRKRLCVVAQIDSGFSWHAWPQPFCAILLILSMRQCIYSGFCRFLSKKSGGLTPRAGVGPPDVNSICFHTPVMDFTIPHTIPPPISLLYCQNEKVNADNCIVRGEYHKDLINTFMIWINGKQVE